MSYKVNFIHMRILIVNHTQNYGSYLTYEYIFFTIIVYLYCKDQKILWPKPT